VADRIGWRWIGWLSVIISLGTVVVLFFTLEETLFDRSAYDVGTIDGVQQTGGTPHPHHSENEKTADLNKSHSPSAVPAESSAEKKKTYSRVP
jgi:hypothetical protein